MRLRMGNSREDIGDEENSGIASKSIWKPRPTRWCRTRRAFPPARSARSAAKASCRNASAAPRILFRLLALSSVAISFRISWSMAARTWKETGPSTAIITAKVMAIKRAFGTFLACTGYPNCKTTRRLASGTKKALQPDVPIGEKCPDDGGELLRRAGRYGDFIGCQNYRSAGTRAPIYAKFMPHRCNEGEFVRRGAAKGRGAGRIFYGCSRYPDCDFTTPHEPIAEPCPKCGAPFIVEKRTKQGNFRACINEKCD